MHINKAVFALFFFYNALHLSFCVKPPAKLLLISFDGFRYDYLTRFNTSWFQYLAQSGSTTERVINQFATKTFPSHWSIVTGQYEGRHGVLNNKMYDRDTEEMFGKRSTEEKWWNGGGFTEPIWVTAERVGIRTGVYFWVGSATSFKGIRPTFYKKAYIKNTPFENRLNDTVGWLVDDDVDFALLYYHEPDGAGHNFGPNSREVRVEVEKVNGYLGELIRRLQEEGIYDNLNIIVTSDHGMAEVTDEIELLNRFNHLGKPLGKPMGVLLQLYANPGKEDELYTTLKEANIPNTTVLSRQETIAKYGYFTGANFTARTADVYLLADEGSFIFWDRKSFSNEKYGSHGYDPKYKSMNPIFVARGPQITKNLVVEPFHQVDIYGLMCRLLNIEGQKNDGEWSRISAIYNFGGKMCFCATVFIISLIVSLFY